MDEEKRKGLEERYWAVLAEYFGYSQSNIIRALEKAAGQLEDLNTQLEGFNKGLEASSKASLRVARALNWITLSLVVVAVVTLGWDVWKWLKNN